jgi:hypothetical protein
MTGGRGAEVHAAAIAWAARKPAFDAPPAQWAQWLRDQVDLLDQLGDSGAFDRVVTTVLRETAAQVLALSVRVQAEVS